MDNDVLVLHKELFHQLITDIMCIIRRYVSQSHVLSHHITVSYYHNYHLEWRVHAEFCAKVQSSSLLSSDPHPTTQSRC